MGACAEAPGLAVTPSGGAGLPRTQRASPALAGTHTRITETGPELDMTAATACDRGQGALSPSAGPPTAMPSRARTDVLRAWAHICLLLQ